MAKYIPETHYVVWREFAEKNPLAFMTVYGTDSAAKGRMATANAWAKRGKNGLGNVKTTFENKPMTGFAIGEEVRRWSTQNVVWRINDPRGFQLEISSGNMAYLLGNCNILKGKIDAELIWVRDGADNYLLPTESEEYATYEQNSKAKQSNTKISDLTPGDYVALASGEKGTYLGMYSCVTLGYVYGRRNGTIVNSRRCHVIRDESKGKARYVAKMSWKGISLIEQGKNENKDYSNEMNENISSVTGPDPVYYVCKEKFDDGAAAKTIFTKPYHYSGNTVYFCEYNSTLYRGSHTSFHHDRTERWEGTLSPCTIDTESNSLIRHAGDSIEVVPYSRARHYMQTKGGRIEPSVVAELDKFTYAIVIDGKEYDISI